MVVVKKPVAAVDYDEIARRVWQKLYDRPIFVDLVSSLAARSSIPIGDIVHASYIDTWTLVEVWDPDGNASASVERVDITSFATTESVKYTHTDGGGSYASTEEVYVDVDINAAPCSELWFVVPLYLDSGSTTYGNVIVYAEYTDTGGNARRVGYFIRRGTYWKMGLAVDIGYYPPKYIPFDRWSLFARDLKLDTAQYPIARLTRLGIRTGEYGETLTLFVDEVKVVCA